MEEKKEILREKSTILSKKEKEKAAKDLIAIDFSPNEEFIHEYKELRKKHN